MKGINELKELDKYLVHNPMYDVMEKLVQKIGGDFNPPITYRVPYNDRIDLWILVSVDFGWEHVSVSLLAKSKEPHLIERTPKWDEMQFVKDLFWKDDECVIQFHPAKKDYVNNHPYVLHLWRPIDEKLPTPPKELV